MGWLEDAADEFRKLPTGGKIAVGVAGVGVVVLAIAHARSSGVSSGVSSTATPVSTSDPLAGLSNLGPSSGVVSGTPSMTSTPDWSNWFNSGLQVPQLGALPDYSASSSSGVDTSSSSSLSSSSSAPAASAASSSDPQAGTSQQIHFSRIIPHPAVQAAQTSQQTHASAVYAGVGLQTPLAASQRAHRGVSAPQPSRRIIRQTPITHTTGSTRGRAF